MLVDIYARAMLNATRHTDLPQRPLASYRKRSFRLGGLARVLKAALGRRLELREDHAPSAPQPMPCK